MIRKWFLFLLMSCFFATGCSNGYHRFISNYTFTNPGGTPDYSNPDHWAALPNKWDPSDSVPRPLRKSYQPDTTADVFFIHPTTYTDKNRKLGWNASVDDAELNAKTDYTSILLQASVFNEAGRIYAPRYRQANYYSYFPQTPEDTVQAKAAFNTAFEDLRTAFTYYLHHYNHGRPIIIASHSQGTTHAKRLVKEFFDGKDLGKQLVAAYLVGMALPPNWFDSIPVCKTPAQTGCAVSWRTLHDGYKPDYIKLEDFEAVSVNPLTWDAGIPYADRYANKGGILLKFNKVMKHVVNAKAEAGVLWTEKPHFTGNILLSSKNYHVADINLFYLSIRENAKLRVAAFAQKK